MLIRRLSTGGAAARVTAKEPQCSSGRFCCGGEFEGVGASAFPWRNAMRPARNAHPEWGYLAPAPGFLRTVQIAIVAAAVGAGAGAAAVFSLVDRPDANESVAARTLTGPNVAALPASPPVAPLITHAADATTAESGAAATTEHPVSAAALAESPPISTNDPNVANAAARQAKTTRRPRGVQTGRSPLLLAPSSRAQATIGANWPRNPRDAY